MQEASKYTVFNIREYLNSQNDGLGEDDLHQVLSEFSCERNLDVEKFAKEQSIEFAKKQQSVTYEEKLLSFYKDKGFQQFDSRLSESVGHELIQLLKILK